MQEKAFSVIVKSSRRFVASSNLSTQADPGQVGGPGCGGGGAAVQPVPRHARPQGVPQLREEERRIPGVRAPAVRADHVGGGGPGHTAGRGDLRLVQLQRAARPALVPAAVVPLRHRGAGLVPAEVGGLGGQGGGQVGGRHPYTRRTADTDDFRLNVSTNNCSIENQTIIHSYATNTIFASALL